MVPEDLVQTAANLSIHYEKYEDGVKTIQFNDTTVGEFHTKSPWESCHVFCGVTAYDFSHLGHARAAVAFDVLYRYSFSLHPFIWTVFGVKIEISLYNSIHYYFISIWLLNLFE